MLYDRPYVIVGGAFVRNFEEVVIRRNGTPLFVRMSSTGSSKHSLVPNLHLLKQIASLQYITWKGACGLGIGNGIGIGGSDMRHILWLCELTCLSLMMPDISTDCASRRASCPSLCSVDYAEFTGSKTSCELIKCRSQSRGKKVRLG